MQLTIDAEAHPVQGDTVGEVLGEAARRAEAAGRLIVEVTVDGATWDQGDLDSPERLAATAERMEVTTESASDLAARTLRDALAALDSIEEDQREAAEAIQADRTQEGWNRLHQALETWSGVQQAAVLSAAVTGIDLEEERRERPATEAAFGSLERLLGELMQAIRANDPVGTTDTLLYEMPEVIDRWRSVLADLAGRATSGREPDA